MPDRDERWFTTRCGRDVLLNAIHIIPFAHGILEGRAETVRKRVLDEMADVARELIRGTTAVYIEPFDFTDESYPALKFFCNFTCFDAVNPAADCSSLTGVWFADGLTQPIPDFLRPRVAQLDWAAHASDGYW